MPMPSAASVRDNVSKMIAHRSEALAMVVLTRIPEVNPVRVDVGPIDFFAFVPGEGSEGFRFFAVIVKGTQKLGSAKAATLWAAKAEDLKNDSAVYVFPTLVLLCSMEDEIVYFAWRMEPSVDAAAGEPRLNKKRRLEFSEFNADTLRTVVASVQRWYDATLQELVD